MAETVIVGLSAASDKQKGQATKGKFLQVTWRGQEHLLFATFERHSYHNQILAEFCRINAIPYRWLNEETLVVDAPGLTVLGGGRFEADPDLRTLALWDDSQAYGRFRMEGLADRIAAADHPCSGYEVNIS